MRDKLRWLAVPPALALVLMFGPWRTPARGNGENPVRPAANAPTEAAKPIAPATPMPDLTQLVTTVLGVCLLGGAVVFGLARLRQRQQVQSGVVLLRQSLRLSGRHTVHAVQFDDKILLLGECDGALRVLRTADDVELALRPHHTDPTGSTPRPDGDDGGAVLKDMVLPRPPARPARAPAAAPARGLVDFRTLLRKSRVDA